MMSFTNEVKELSRKDRAKLLEKGYLFTSDSSILLDGWIAIVINAYLRQHHGKDVNYHDVMGIIGSNNAGTIRLGKLTNVSNWIMPPILAEQTSSITPRRKDYGTFFHIKFKSAEDCMNYRLTFM